MYVRDDNYMPIGAIMIKREFNGYDDLFRVAVSLCHPKEINQFRKKSAWNILNGKMKSDKQSITFSLEALQEITLDEIFLEFDIKHLQIADQETNVSHEYSPRVCGNPKTDVFAYVQLDILRNNTERFRKTFNMMVDKKEPSCNV